jgi:hypothetical protein
VAGGWWLMDERDFVVTLDSQGRSTRMIWHLSPPTH